MFFRTTFLIACLLTACAPDAGDPSAPGSYLKKISDTEAQMIIITATKQRTIIPGTFQNELTLPPYLGRIAPVSISGAYKVTTPNCGVLHFFEGKGVGLICQECETINANRGAYSKCELSKFNNSLLWLPIGI